MDQLEEFTPEQEKLFAKGFNAGYELQKDNPQLLDKLTSDTANKNKTFFLGLEEGRKEYITEKYMETVNTIKDKQKDSSLDK
jgi:hypothetical protein